MITSMTHSQVYVLDQDEALDFYVGKLGMEVNTDADLGFMRWLTVNVPGDPEHQLLLEKPGPPAHDDATAEQIRELVTKGALGMAGIFVVEDVHKSYEELKAKGVEFTEEPTERFYGTDCGLRDPFGNPIRIGTPKDGPIEMPELVRRRTSAIQRLVHRANDEGAVADGRRHSLGRATSHVPDGEDVRSGGLQEQGLAVAAFSMLGKARMTPRVLAGDDEPLVVETDQAVDVLGPRGGPDHGEHTRGVQSMLALIAAGDRDRLELIAAVEGLHLASLPDLDVAGGFDAIDEVAGHRRGQRSSHDEVDPTRVGGQVDHRLSG